MDHTETYTRLRDAANKEMEQCLSASGAKPDDMRHYPLEGS